MWHAMANGCLSGFRWLNKCDFFFQKIHDESSHVFTENSNEILTTHNSGYGIQQLEEEREVTYNIPLRSQDKYIGR